MLTFSHLTHKRVYTDLYTLTLGLNHNFNVNFRVNQEDLDALPPIEKVDIPPDVTTMVYDGKRDPNSVDPEAAKVDSDAWNRAM